MNYNQFKQLYFGSFSEGELQLESNSSNEETKLQFVVQEALDKTFKLYAKRPDITKPLPVWLIGIYNDFIRLIESKDLSKFKKHYETLQLAEELFVKVFTNLGKEEAKMLFTSKSMNHQTAA